MAWREFEMLLAEGFRKRGFEVREQGGTDADGGVDREWKLTKAKDGRDGDAHAFRLRVGDLGTDKEGERVTSCVVEADTAAEQVKRAPLPQGATRSSPGRRYSRSSRTGAPQPSWRVAEPPCGHAGGRHKRRCVSAHRTP